MVSRSQHCQEGDDARVSFKEALLGMVDIVWQIKPNLWWSGGGGMFMFPNIAIKVQTIKIGKKMDMGKTMI